MLKKQLRISGVSSVRRIRIENELLIWNVLLRGVLIYCRNYHVISIIHDQGRPAHPFKFPEAFVSRCANLRSRGDPCVMVCSNTVS